MYGHYPQTMKRFVRLPNGVHYRVVNRFDVEAERQREWEQSPEGRAKAKALRAAERLADQREADFSRAEMSVAYKKATREFKNRVHDVIQTRKVWRKVDGVDVAAVDFLVMYQMDADADMGGCEDAVHIVVYRDPQKPKRLLDTCYC
jgi:hypothetical protein